MSGDYAPGTLHDSGAPWNEPDWKPCPHPGRDTGACAACGFGTCSECVGRRSAFTRDGEERALCADCDSFMAVCVDCREAVEVAYEGRCVRCDAATVGAKV